MEKVTRRIVRRREVEPEPEPEDIEDDLEGVEEDLDEDLDEDYDEDLEEVVEEEPVRKQPRRVEAAQSAAKPARKVEAAKPTRKAEPVPAKAKPAKVAVAEDEEPEEEPEEVKTVKVRKVSQQVADDLLTSLINALEDGNTLVFTRKGDAIAISTSTQPISSSKLRGKEYWSKVRNPAYEDWKKEWRQKSFEQKKAYAKKIGAQWDPHDNPKIEEMRVSTAVREKEGISKYQPEYEDRKARASVRG